MRKLTSVYLAGPDAFAPDGATLIARKRAICESMGLKALTAGDETRRETRNSEAMAREIYAGALATLRRADALIANLTPWRGPGCDPATAFEAGFAAALGKPVFAYMNVADEASADYQTRVEMMVGATLDQAGVWRDVEGCEIEDFGLPESLMLWAEARRFFVIVTPDPLADLTGLELCLDTLALYAE